MCFEQFANETSVRDRALHEAMFRMRVNLS